MIRAAVPESPCVGICLLDPATGCCRGCLRTLAEIASWYEASVSEKRAILASWASDASAIASCPSLRAPEGLKAPVTIDEILEALCALDQGPRNPPGGEPMRLRPVERVAA